MSDFLGCVISLTGCRDRTLLAATAAEALMEMLDARSVCVHRCVGSPVRLLRLAAVRRGEAALGALPEWTPIEALPVAAEHAPRARALDSGRMVVCVNEEAGSEGACSLFPLTLGRQRIGLIEICSARPLAVDQQRFVTGLLKVYRNQLSLLDYGECDTLTGLLNRKTFDAEFTQCLHADSAAAEVRPAGLPERRGRAATHWLAVIDIDHFKRVNDAHGHLIGDEVLLLVAQRLRQNFRQGDRLYRFGGEEFVVLLRAANRRAAGTAVERFRAAMAAQRFPQVGQVTVSIGYTELRPLDNASAAFERADRAVYRAKDAGRDRVICHEALVEAGDAGPACKVGDIELF